MKLNTFIFIATASFALSIRSAAQQAAIGSAEQGTVGSFYDALVPYGEWISVEGTAVWHPVRMREGWRPYALGRWVWTAYGWYWVSTEPFGWAVFHYGRWVCDDYYGWIWIPDRTWGPGWVDWRFNDDYIGWAPLAPRNFHVSFSIYFGPRWSPPWHHWNFIRCGDFGTAYRYREYIPESYMRRIIGTTRRGESFRNDNGRIINRGVDREFIERRTRERIDQAEIQVTDERRESFTRSDGRSRIEIYRPSFNAPPPVRSEIRRGNRGFSFEQERARAGSSTRTGEQPRQNIETPVEQRFREERGRRVAPDQIQAPVEQRFRNPSEQSAPSRESKREEFRQRETSRDGGRSRATDAPPLRQPSRQVQPNVPAPSGQRRGGEPRRR